MVIAAAALGPRAEKGKQMPVESPRTNAETSQGCFESQGELKDAKDMGVKYDPTEMSRGKCKDLAREEKAVVFAMKGEHCYLGEKYPAENKLVDDEKCNFPCPAYQEEACGGLTGGSYFSVFNTGLELDVPYSDEENSETSSAPKDDEEDSGGSVNVAGIAAGTVVGVLAVAGAVGGTFFYMRRKRNNEIEEEHRRNAAVNSFIGGGGHSVGGSVTDARLDPIMAQRRMSDGSIADNEDYSRRILRVTNV